MGWNARQAAAGVPGQGPRRHRSHDDRGRRRPAAGTATHRSPSASDGRSERQTQAHRRLEQRAVPLWAPVRGRHGHAAAGSPDRPATRTTMRRRAGRGGIAPWPWLTRRTSFSSAAASWVARVPWRWPKRALGVMVLERSVPGAEASSAAAGILGAQTEAHAEGAFTELALLSRYRYSAWAERLRSQTGIDVGYRASGVLRVALEAPGAKHARRGRRHGKPARASESSTSTARPSKASSLRWPRESPAEFVSRTTRAWTRRFAAQSPAHRGALLGARCFAREPTFGASTKRAARVRGVVLDDGSRVAAAHVVVAAGSWSTLVGGLPLESAAVRPARGQIVELDAGTPLLRLGGFRPALLPGASRRRPCAGGLDARVRGLSTRGHRARRARSDWAPRCELVPALADASLGRTWSNFRPYTESGRPLLGPTRIEGLWLATGHYRNGILLAPITAEIICALVPGSHSARRFGAVQRWLGSVRLGGHR